MSVDGTGDAQTGETVGRVGLIMGVRDHQHRPARPHGQARGADTAGEDHGRCPGEEVGKGSILEGSHALRQ